MGAELKNADLHAGIMVLLDGFEACSKAMQAVSADTFADAQDAIDSIRLLRDEIRVDDPQKELARDINNIALLLMILSGIATQQAMREASK